MLNKRGKERKKISYIIPIANEQIGRIKVCEFQGPPVIASNTHPEPCLILYHLTYFSLLRFLSICWNVWSLTPLS